MPDSASNLIKRYYDRLTDVMLTSEIDQLAPGGNITTGVPALGTTTGDKIYGYT